MEPSTQSTGQEAHGSSRRTLLNALLGGSLAGWLATALFPVLRYLSPLKSTENADEIELGEGTKKEIEARQFAIVPLGTDRVIVLRDPKQQIRACSAICTHEGCTVQYLPAETLIWCACHNGRYDIEGRVISGPPPRPLAPYRVTGTLETKVVVSRESA